MKINFKLDERKISKSSRSKIYDLGQVTATVQDLLDNSEITITDNLIPIIKITSIDDETSYYLLPDLNYDWGNISGRNDYSFTIDDLIALGGESGGGVQQYKFLLSQTGGDDPQTATSGSLTQGVTYEIVAFETGDNFIPSGAPNNTVGTKWIANGTAPTWSNGSELGWNGGAPILTEELMLNTLDYDIWFEKSIDDGFQSVKSDDNFDDKTTIAFGSTSLLSDLGDPSTIIEGGRNSNTLGIVTLSISGATPSNGALYNTWVHIIQY